MTEVQINRARDEYRLPPAEAARVWFVVADLAALHPMYTASLAGFTGMIRHCIKVSWEPCMGSGTQADRQAVCDGARTQQHGQRYAGRQAVWGLVRDMSAPPSHGASHLACRARMFASAS